VSLAADLRVALDPAAMFRLAFGLDPLEWQHDYLRETRPATVLKGRQVGASASAGVLAVHTAVYRAGSNTVIVSPSLKQSTEITTRARAGLRAIGCRLEQDSASMLRLANGSRILSLPGTARSVRGWTADLLILDEAAYLEDATIVAARALAATGGRTVMQSTPNAESGAFYEAVQADDPAWAHFYVPSASVPTITPEFLAAERRTLGPDAYATEYECVFGKAGATLFTAERLAALVLGGVPA
jgi:hypothetical protein